MAFRLTDTAVLKTRGITSRRIRLALVVVVLTAVSAGTFAASRAIVSGGIPGPCQSRSYCRTDDGRPALSRKHARPSRALPRKRLARSTIPRNRPVPSLILT